MSCLQLNRHIGFWCAFSYVSGLGGAAAPPFPPCFGTDVQNSMIDVGNVNGALFLQPDK
ncbi:hypothetical protein C7405_104438, partial [Paraburkholderia caballeronis]